MSKLWNFVGLFVAFMEFANADSDTAGCVNCSVFNLNPAFIQHKTIVTRNPRNLLNLKENILLGDGFKRCSAVGKAIGCRRRRSCDDSTESEDFLDRFYCNKQYSSYISSCEMNLLSPFHRECIEVSKWTNEQLRILENQIHGTHNVDRIVMQTEFSNKICGFIKPALTCLLCIAEDKCVDGSLEWLKERLADHNDYLQYFNVRHISLLNIKQQEMNCPELESIIANGTTCDPLPTPPPPPSTTIPQVLESRMREEESKNAWIGVLLRTTLAAVAIAAVIGLIYVVVRATKKLKYSEVEGNEEAKENSNNRFEMQDTESGTLRTDTYRNAVEDSPVQT